MKKKVLISIFFLASTGCKQQATLPTAATVHVVSTSDMATVTDIHFPSASVNKMVWYRAIVPNGKAGEHYPVLYLLHGANSDPIDILAHTEIVKLAYTARLIVVMPEAGMSYFTNAKHDKSSRWEDVIAKELTHDATSRFPLMIGREHSGIAGISMGGYGAAKIALKHPDLYSFVGVMSGALDITNRPTSLKRWGQTERIWSTFGYLRSSRKEEDVFELLAKSKDISTLKWFVSCGEKDPLFATNRKLIRELRLHGVTVEALSSPGWHDWGSWNLALPKMLRMAGTSLR